MYVRLAMTDARIIKNSCPLLAPVSFQDPAISDIYTEHSCPVNVAKYSPSGFYIASGGE